MLDLLSKLALTLDQSCHLLVRHRLAELHVNLLILLEDIHDFLYALLDNLDYGLVRIHLRLLLKVSHRVARCPYHFTLVSLLDTCDNLHERRLTRAIETHDTDLCAIEERQVNVLEDYPIVVREDLSHPVHRKNDLLVCHIII